MPQSTFLASLGPALHALANVAAASTSPTRLRAMDFYYKLTPRAREQLAVGLDYHLHDIRNYVTSSGAVSGAATLRLAQLLDEHIDRVEAPQGTTEDDSDDAPVSRQPYRAQVTEFLRAYKGKATPRSFARGVGMTVERFDMFMDSDYDGRFLNDEWDAHWARIAVHLSAEEDTPEHRALLLPNQPGRWYAKRTGKPARIDPQVWAVVDKLTEGRRDSGVVVTMVRKPFTGEMEVEVELP